MTGEVHDPLYNALQGAISGRVTLYTLQLTLACLNCKTALMLAWDSRLPGERLVANSLEGATANSHKCLVSELVYCKPALM